MRWCVDVILHPEERKCYLCVLFAVGQLSKDYKPNQQHKKQAKVVYGQFPTHNGLSRTRIGKLFQLLAGMRCVGLCVTAEKARKNSAHLMCNIYCSSFDPLFNVKERSFGLPDFFHQLSHETTVFY